ncbi:mismatch-specific DNA-glycosylase [Paramagnetospirillum marisnigri]|uniref:Mismatch-specific DNA-glycosylase n=1 Tax=Paramagnetospirillum marisnigri TaxID=1285242 RepID=A0A178ME21_9PROT|nr:mismatch-specific DNA-glycosylase [Paramagnetospirillum marisnigri]
MIVPDVLADGLKLVLCGTAPSRASKEAGAYYAHPGNIFWISLFEAGLTPRLLAPAECREVLGFGLGLTDLNKTEWGADAELSREGFDVAGFVEKMRRHRPGMIAFSSKFAAGVYFARRSVGYGLQSKTLDGIPLFVLPSTSGRARMYFDRRPWDELGRCVQDRLDDTDRIVWRSSLPSCEKTG